ncbi:MAG: metal ABC transporter permease [Candidatus Caldarchaeum sp.]
MIDVFQQPFMARALAAGVIASFLLPLLGNFLIPKKLSLLGDASSHFVFASLAVSALVGLSSGVLSYPLAVIAVFGMLQMVKGLKMAGDQALAIFLALGGATASIAISSGARINLNAVLFGSVFLVELDDLLAGVAIASLTGFFIIKKFREIVIFTVNEELARVRGVPVKLYELLLAAVSGLSIVAGVKIAGILLVTALLVLPAVSISLVATSMKKAITLSIAIGESCMFAGIVSSYYTGMAPGASTVYILLAIFAMSGALMKMGIKI